MNHRAHFIDYHFPRLSPRRRRLEPTRFRVIMDEQRRSFPPRLHETSQFVKTLFLEKKVFFFACYVVFGDCYTSSFKALSQSKRARRSKKMM